MKSVSFEPRSGWEAHRHSLCYDEYFQHEQTLFVNRTADGMRKEKERVKWVGYILPVPLLLN
ncbi:MAG: hypothetical protein AB8G86_10190 [Saprospiraceae bacterium]